jgi:hypothetical protein
MPFYTYPDDLCSSAACKTFATWAIAVIIILTVSTLIFAWYSGWKTYHPKVKADVKSNWPDVKKDKESN